MDEEFQADQIEKICEAITDCMSYRNADALEHTLGASGEERSLVGGLFAIAGAVSELAAAVRDIGKEEPADPTGGYRPA